METFKGTLYGFFETGTEGTLWVLLKDDMKGYEAIESIREGDHLKVFGTTNEVVFDGIIKEDAKTGWMEYPLNPGYGQPAALGYWIHWTQAGWTPDDWAKLFFTTPNLRAELSR